MMRSDWHRFEPKTREIRRNISKQIQKLDPNGNLNNELTGQRNFTTNQGPRHHMRHISIDDHQNLSPDRHPSQPSQIPRISLNHSQDNIPTLKDY